MRERKLLELIRKNLQNEVITKEEANDWKLFVSDKSNERQFQEIEKYWRQSGKVRLMMHVDTQKSWSQFESNLTHSGRALLTVKWYEKNIFKLVASVALVFLIGILIYFSNYSTHAEKVTIIADEQTKEVQLPDESVVLLNKNSKISYNPEFFAVENRALEMQGEVFFDVKKNKNLPFIVKRDEMRIEVLGTSFNVNSYSKNSPLEVLVKSGKVSVYYSDQDDKKIILTKGNSAIYDWDKKTLEKKNTFDWNRLSWKTKSLDFDDVQLREVFETIESYFDIRISVENEKLLNCKFTSSFADPSLEEVIEAIVISLDLTYKIRDNKSYLFNGKSC